MIAMARDTDYPELLSALRGRRVILCSCGTCASICGVGKVGDLAERLSSDGVEVVSSTRSKACCLMSNAMSMAAEKGDADVVLALCCDMGARNLAEASGLETLNPVVTFGPGYLDEDKRVHLASVVCGRTVVDELLEDAAERSGCRTGPFRSVPSYALY